MKKQLAYFLACACLFWACGNGTSPNRQSPTESKAQMMPVTLAKIESKNQYESPCTFKKDAHKRLDNTFPFNKATKIEAISFDLKKFYEESKTQNNSRGVPVEIADGILFVAHVKHRYFLSPSQTQKLFETLVFNQGEDSGKMRCYEPNEVLVFYEEDEAFAFLELCFHCKHWRNYKVDFKDFCDQKWETLATFFPARKE